MSISSYNLPHKFLITLFALYPLVAVSIKSGGSSIYALLFLTSLIVAWPTWHSLSIIEKRWILGYVALFTLAAISLIYSEEIYNAVKRLERYLRLMSIGILYMMLVRLNVEVGRYFLVGITLAAIFLGLQAIYHVHYLHLPEASGLYYRIGVSAFGVLTAAISCVAILTVAKTNIHKIGLLISLVFGLYAAYLSGGRGGWLALPIILVMMLWVVRKTLNRKVIIYIGIGLFVITSLLIISKPKILVDGVNRVVSDVYLYMDDPSKFSSAGDRLNMWRNSLIIWSNNPLLGTGIGDFQADSQKLINEGISYRNEVAYGHAHSIYFDTLATMGIVGLIIMLLALFIVPWLLFNQYWYKATIPWQKFYALSGMITVVAFAVYGLSEGWLSRNPFINPYVVYITAFAASLKVTDRQKMTDFG